ncbi:hypothetical protein JMUB5056_0306 [Leptotrichia hongkongensis]|uniref:Uncharacterized protein n=1 Tax=Leptotrichia hongkongensis TaxID=554406 RepID=A0A510L4J1_9FUSO|nr:hypothetical protein JMUB5056_0306 [Leptotrichia hongkongensis]
MVRFGGIIVDMMYMDDAIEAIIKLMEADFYKFNKYIKCKLRSTKELEIYKKYFF